MKTATHMAQTDATMNAMGELRIVVHGQMTSSNAFKAPDANGKLRKTKEAREDARRVREIGIVVATGQGWECPPAVAVVLYAFNSRLDADNVSKVPFDALKGVAWKDDADVMDFDVRRRWDREGERYEIVVTATEDQRPGAKRAASRAPGSRPAAKGRALDEFRSGDVLDFEQRDRVLRELGIR